MLRLDRVSYTYAGSRQERLHSVSLELPDSTITGLVGPTGAGKSSLCLVAAGLAPRVIGGRLSGGLEVDGEPATSWPMSRMAGSVALAVQDPAAQLTMVADSVYEEVAVGPVNLGCSRAETMQRTEEALEQLGIGHLAARDPRLLSGGQQQLVVLAGLLAMRTGHLVLDEPFAHLDADGSGQLVEALRSAQARGCSVLVAEQRTDILLRACDSIAVIAAGNIVVQGRPIEILADPSIGAMGVAEPAEVRLARLAEESGLSRDGHGGTT